MDSDEERILQEVRDHATYWHSDKAKRITVERHLKQKGMKDVEIKIDDLIRTGKLTHIPQPRGEYLKEAEPSRIHVSNANVERMSVIFAQRNHHYQNNSFLGLKQLSFLCL